MKLSRDLNDLDEKCRFAADVLLDEFKQCRINETGRTEAQQRENIKTGVSWTMDSMHMMNPKARAFDIYFTGDELYPSDEDGTVDEDIWMPVINRMKECGMNNGGIMWGKDWMHFECDGSTINKDTMDRPMKKQLESEVPKDLQIFNNYDGDDGEVKALINIGIFRFHKAEAMSEFKKFNNQ